MDKTNVMRLLDKAKIPYTPHEYDPSVTDGQTVAELVGADPAATFKTLVCLSDKNEPLVFVVPVDGSLDLKRAAKAAGVKSVSMLKQKDLLGLTGYVHGGCSPIGMKKRFRTFFNSSFTEHERVFFSAGKLGHQVELSPQAALDYLGASVAELLSGQ